MTDDLPVAPPRATARAVWAGTRGHRRTAAVALVALVAGAAAALVVPLLVGRVIDRAGSGGGGLGWTAGAALAAVVVSAVLSAVGHGATGAVCEQVLSGLRHRVLARVLALPQQRAEAAGRGSLTGRVVGDVAAVSDVARGALAAFVSAALTIALTAVALAGLDWRLALAGLAPLPLWVLATRWYVRRSPVQYAEERAADTEVARVVLGSLSGLGAIRSLGLADEHTAAAAESSRRSVAAAMRACTTRVLFFAHLSTAELLGLLSVLGACFLLVGADAVTLGSAAAAVLLFLRLFEPVTTLLSLLDEVQSAGAALSRLVGVADLPPEAEGRDHDGVGVLVEDVSHGYGAHPVLSEVSLHVAPGERVALVGASGAGKSTLVGLMAGTQAPVAGSVAADRAALITQESHVFAGALAEDLRLVAPGASTADLHAALDRVGALDWALGLPDGLDTVVGAGGHAVPPHRARQLALARVLLDDPPVVLLDEPTADSHGRDRDDVDRSVAAVLDGRTSVVVAHRLTDARAADRVVVLDGGRVVEEGGHTELLARGGRYAALWAAWTTARPGSAAGTPGTTRRTRLAEWRVYANRLARSWRVRNR